MLKCSLTNIDKLFENVSKAMPLYLPVEDKKGTVFTKWQEGTVWSNCGNTSKRRISVSSIDCVMVS